MLLLAACSGDSSAVETVWNAALEPDRIELDRGSSQLGTVHRLSRWFGSEAEAGEAAGRFLSDSRPAIRVTTPSLWRVRLPADSRPRLLRSAVRLDGDPRAPNARMHAEVFLRDDSGLKSLGAIDVPSGVDPRDVPEWTEFQAEIPAGSATVLEFIARRADPASAGRPGPELAWAAPVVTAAPDPAGPRRPDVLLLTIDTMRADALASAPRLSGLFARGSLWTRAVAPSNWTLPSYASLFTALDADVHGAGRARYPTVDEPHARDFVGIGAALPTLAEAFRDAGYTTAMFHQNPFLEPWSGLERGFERYVRTRENAALGVAAAREWWEDEAHRPRFLILHLMGPHLPYSPPGDVDALGEPLPADPLAGMPWRDFLAGSPTAEQRRAFFDLPEDAREILRRRYRAEIGAVDAAAAGWLESLAGTGTILVLHSDHGEEHWDDGSFEHGHSFADAVVRVPLGVLGPARRQDFDAQDSVAVRDLGPSLLDWAGVPRPPGWTGSLWAPLVSPRSLQPLYPSEFGGRIFGTASDKSGWLPFDPQRHAAQGAPAELDPALQRALAELGYVDAPR